MGNLVAKIVRKFSRPKGGASIASEACHHHKVANHDVFLSYRWESDGERSETLPKASSAVPMLHAELAARGLTAFWDVKCLDVGEPLIGGFTVALAGSKLAVLVISQRSLDRVRDHATHRTDNVLLEWELAVKIKGHMLPVFVGEVANDADSYKKYPNTRHHGSGICIRDTVRDIFGRVYVSINPSGPGGVVLPADIAVAVTEICKMVSSAPAPASVAGRLRKQMEAAAKAKLVREEAEWAWLAPVIALKDEVGKGSSAIVYRGVLDGQSVAVKALRSGSTANVVVQFAKEASLMSRLDHSNVMRCLHFVKRGDAECYLVMPLADLGSLAEPAIAAKALLCDGQQLIRVLQGAADGLAYLHCQAIVHRDVKPGNILLGRVAGGGDTPWPYVADLGISRSGLAETVAGTALAFTPGFMAPEVSHNLLSSKSDVFSFGVTILVLTTGKDAFRIEGTGGNTQTIALIDVARADSAAGRPASEQAAPGVVWDPPQALEGLLRLAIHCTEPERLNRPSMMDVSLALADLRLPSGGSSEFYSLPTMLTSTDVRLCLICEENPRDIVFVPCQHAVACSACARKFRDAPGATFSCHICRAEVERIEPALFPVTRTWQGAGKPSRIEYSLKAAEDAKMLIEFEAAVRAEAESAEWCKSAYAVSAASLEPAEFDAILEPGQALQGALDRLRDGGSLLLLPGTYFGPLYINKEVHVFGRGMARLEATGGDSCIVSTANVATVAGLLIRWKDSGRKDLSKGRTSSGAFIKAGGIRVMACDITSGLKGEGLLIQGEGADPIIDGCRYGKLMLPFYADLS